MQNYRLFGDTIGYVAPCAKTERGCILSIFKYIAETILALSDICASSALVRCTHIFTSEMNVEENVNCVLIPKTGQYILLNRDL